MMIDHVWTVVCSRAVVDRFTNNVSLQNAIEQFSIKGEPEPDALLPIPFEIMTLWTRSDLNVPATGSQRLTLISPSGEKMKEMVFTLNLTGKYRRFRTRAAFNGLIASEPGRYVFQVEFQETAEHDWQIVANVPLEVIFEQPEVDQDGSEEE